MEIILVISFVHREHGTGKGHVHVCYVTALIEPVRLWLYAIRFHMSLLVVLHALQLQTHSHCYL